MAVSSANVRVAVTGGVYRGTVGATLPTTTSAALTGFTELGYVSEAGVREQRTISSDDIKAWQNNDVVRTVVTDAKVTYAFTLIETTKAVLEAYHGTTGTTGTGEGSIQVQPSATGGRTPWVIDIIDGAAATRIVIPAGEITDRGEVVYANGDAIGYELTVTAYATAGVAATKYTTALAT